MLYNCKKEKFEGLTGLENLYKQILIEKKVKYVEIRIDEYNRIG